MQNTYEFKTPTTMMWIEHHEGTDQYTAHRVYVSGEHRTFSTDHLNEAVQEFNFWVRSHLS